MTRLIPLKYKDITKKLQRTGFRFYRQGKGSHELWVRDSDGKVIPVPKHLNKDIKKGTLKSIIRGIGITTEEFMRL